ncbi:MAG: CvpA family protein, partial [Clostridiales bacterium]|nr:CvpA family protein [Clostridiales bacterium]
MNWADLTVILILILFAFIGYKRGFVLSVYSIVSILIALVLAFLLYPGVSQMLLATPLKGTLETGITQKLTALQTGGITSAQVTGDQLMTQLKLPELLRPQMAIAMGDMTKSMDFSAAIQKISSSFAEFLMNIVSMVILFCIVLLILHLLKGILKKIVKIPVIKQADKLGGFLFGIAQGVLVLFVLVSLLHVFGSTGHLTAVIDQVQNSKVADWFYS